MAIQSFVSTQQSVSILLNEHLAVCGVSDNLKAAGYRDRLTDNDFTTVFRLLFFSSTFRNDKYLLALKEKIHACFATHEPLSEQVVLSNDLPDSSRFLSLSVNIDYIDTTNPNVYVRFYQINAYQDLAKFHTNVFSSLENEFDILHQVHRIGKFSYDIETDPNHIYADDNFAMLLGKEINDHHYYRLVRDPSLDDATSILFGAPLQLRFSVFMSQALDRMSHSWRLDQSWLQLEAKVLKRDKHGKPRLIGGILYDITAIKSLSDRDYLFSIYELAIQTGAIGIFYYDYDKYPRGFFEANKIYENMIGLDKNEHGLYRLSDFEQSLMPLEEDISNNVNINESLNKLLGGDIEGTTDEVIKMKNLKTGSVFYVLSSSRIDARYEDGSPRRFGGVVIDITDNIERQLRQMRYANMDELTGLPNHRKLVRDMQERPDGLGMFFDLDNFKKVNDQYGHLTGDELLRAFASALTRFQKEVPGVFLYRLYGDEFFVFVESQDASDIHHHFAAIATHFQMAQSHLQLDIRVEASGGYSLYTRGMDIDDFIKTADYAMYETKISKKQKAR